ncbi:hypothetical protein ABK040_006660 [Willaertia magna]
MGLRFSRAPNSLEITNHHNNNSPRQSVSSNSPSSTGLSNSPNSFIGTPNELKNKKDIKTILKETFNNVNDSVLDKYVTYYTDKESLKNKYFNFDSIDDFNFKVKCKLVLIDIEEYLNNKWKARLLTNIIKLRGNSSHFGLIHSGISIGSYMIHWFDNSLVTLNKTTKNPNCVVDLGELDLRVEEDVEKLDKLCELIVDYNVNRMYSPLKLNCQHFVIDCMRVLKMEKEFGGQLGEYFKSIKDGNLSTKFFINPITQERVEFLSHRQLDLYCRELFEKNPNFYKDYPNDYALLKAYDRGYWVGHVKDVFIKKVPRVAWEDKYIPLKGKDLGNNQYHDDVCLCCFNDPTSTGSVLLM